ncbi:C-terminal binding protein [Savagea sp. SN6]|uniref:C-terminal binding protein n=2 Tax=Savagea serpentis TaxID=2785297 RepID=A0A8J7G3T2_9BACL|nr:C-terminal binding protein [Savagea serpentis]
MFEEAGLEFQILQSREKERIIEAAKTSDALLILYADIDEDILKEAQEAGRLQIVSRYGIGINMVDVAAAKACGIDVANVNDYCIDEVSDHSLAFILAAARRIIPYYNDTRAGHWDFKVADLPIRSSKATVGLLGFGKIPRRLAEKLNAIGYNVMAYDPFVSEEDMRAVDVEKATVEEIIAESDFISVHVPLIEATHHLLNREAFQAMKSNAYIINTARGPIIDEEAMIEALQNGEIAGAYLDVTETEPLPANSPLRTLPNVVLSPHAAWYSEDAFFEIRYKAIQNIIEKSEGKTPTYLIHS